MIFRYWFHFYTHFGNKNSWKKSREFKIIVASFLIWKMKSHCASLKKLRKMSENEKLKLNGLRRDHSSKTIFNPASVRVNIFETKRVFHIVPLRYKKRGYLRKCNGHPIVTCGSRVSRAPPHHPLPVFLNLHDSFRKKIWTISVFYLSNTVSYSIYDIWNNFVGRYQKNFSIDVVATFDYLRLRIA